MFNRSKLTAQPGTRQDHDRLMAIVNSISDGFLGVDAEGNIDLNNGVALDILNSNSLVGRKISACLTLVDQEGKPKDISELMDRSGESFSSRDYQLTFKDGSAIDIYINISPVREAFGSRATGGHVVLFRDITSEKNREAERDEFISVASHELRTPVAIAEGSVSNAALLAERSNIPESITHVLKTAHDQIVFLGNLINDLAMLSRADRGKVALTIEEVDVGQIISSLSHDYRAQAEKQGLDLRVRPPESLKINSSALYVREILQNFVTNALKYTEVGSITIEAVPTPGGVDFSVTDTGIGIGQGEQAKLFGKFFRSEDWRVRKASGTGLGLYVSSKLARLIGASINMQSELNKGSRFVLHVPSISKDQAAQYKKQAIA